MKTLKEYYTIKLHDTDAAGILFFSNQFKFAHDMYEKLLAQIGYPLRQRFERGDFYMPIVHAEADYRQPLKVGDTIEIELRVANIGHSSFTLEYKLTDLDTLTIGTVQTVHVTVDAGTMRKIELPRGFRSGLEEFVAAD